MTPEGDATVLVNFEIDRRDLFRVNLDLAKWGLLVAAFQKEDFGLSTSLLSEISLAPSWASGQKCRVY